MNRCCYRGCHQEVVALVQYTNTEGRYAVDTFYPYCLNHALVRLAEFGQEHTG